MDWFFLIVQIVFIIVAILGIGMYSIPAAIFTLGVVGAWAMQRALVAQELAKRDRQRG